LRSPLKQQHTLKESFACTRKSSQPVLILILNILLLILMGGKKARGMAPGKSPGLSKIGIRISAFCGALG
jgi:hypothetical protein